MKTEPAEGYEGFEGFGGYEGFGGLAFGKVSQHQSGVRRGAEGGYVFSFFYLAVDDVTRNREEPIDRDEEERSVEDRR